MSQETYESISEQIDQWNEIDIYSLAHGKEEPSSETIVAQDKEGVIDIDTFLDTSNRQDKERAKSKIINKLENKPLNNKEEGEEDRLNILNLSERFNKDEEYIMQRQDIYDSIPNRQKVLGEVSEDDISELVEDAKSNQKKEFIDNITSLMGDSIVDNILEDITLEPITENSLFIQKEQKEFYTTTTEKISNWSHLIENEPEILINDVYIRKLLTSFDFKVVSPDLMDFERSFIGDRGFMNFLTRVSAYVPDEQSELIDSLILFIEKNNIEEIKIDKIFRL